MLLHPGPHAICSHAFGVGGEMMATTTLSESQPLAYMCQFQAALLQAGTDMVRQGSPRTCAGAHDVISVLLPSLSTPSSCCGPSS